MTQTEGIETSLKIHETVAVKFQGKLLHQNSTTNLDSINKNTCFINISLYIRKKFANKVWFS